MTSFFGANHTRRRVAGGLVLGSLAVGTVVGATVVGTTASPAAAAPSDELIAGILSRLPSGSSDADLPGILRQLPIPGLPGSPGTSTGTTRCTSVVQIGDSTSVAVDSPTGVPTAGDTATAQFTRVGVTKVTVDAASGRTIVGPTGEGRPGAEEAVDAQLKAGRGGCWVIAMGINDAGAISSGSSVGADERIDRIMRRLSGQPVLWPTVTSSSPTNAAFGTAAMSAFNDALRKATTRYPNLAVYDWAGAATPQEFTDGIHYTAAGYAERNRRFADALAVAYPSNGSGPVPARNWIPA